MSRIEKLYTRLASLEDEYLRLVREEFQAESDGLSMPWMRYRYPWYRSTSPTIPDDPARVDRIERLEREIVAIRRGIGEPIPGRAVTIPREVYIKFDERGVLQNEGEWLRIVRDAISRIDAIQRAVC